MLPHEVGRRRRACEHTMLVTPIFQPRDARAPRWMTFQLFDFGHSSAERKTCLSRLCLNFIRIDKSTSRAISLSGEMRFKFNQALGAASSRAAMKHFHTHARARASAAARRHSLRSCTLNFLFALKIFRFVARPKCSIFCEITAPNGISSRSD